MDLKQIILFLLFSASVLNAQPKNGKIDVLSVKEGIDGLIVDNYFFDNNNKIWLKTYNCLNVCSPKHVENIYFGNSSNNIHSKLNIALINDNNTYIDIFYKSETGFFDRYNQRDNTFSKVFFSNLSINRNSKYIGTIRFDTDIYIISQFNNKLNIYNVYNQESKSILFDDGIKVKDIIFFKSGYYILDDKGNVFEIDTNNNISQIKIDFLGNKKKFVVNGNPINQDRQIFFLDSKERLWYSPKQKSGVYLKNKKESKFHLFSKLPTGELFTWVSQDKTGKLLFGSTDRYRFTKRFYILELDNSVNIWNYLDKVVEFPKKVISTDFYKNIFISTYRSLMIIDFTFNNFLSNYFVNHKLIVKAGSYGNVIWGLSQINSDSIFFSSEKHFNGIYNISKKEAFKYSKKNNLYLFYSLFCSKDNSIWSIGKRNFSSKDNLLVKTEIKTGLNKIIQSPINIYSIENKNNGDFFLGGKTIKGKYCIYLFEPMALKYTKILELPHKPYHIKWDKKNHKLWCLDDINGPFIVDFNKNLNVSQLVFNKKNIAKYHSIDFGNSNKIFISTNNGVYIWNSEEQKIVKHLTTKNGLSTNNVCAVAEDVNDNIWISTFYGLNIYYWAIDKTHSYFIKDGLPNDEFNTKSVLIDEKNNIYFGNSNGIVVVNINEFYRNNYKILFKEIETIDNSGSKVIKKNENKPIKIHFDNRSEVKINLDIKDWRNKKSARFYANLYPIQNKWNEHGFSNIFTFDHLPYGEYDLKFISINNEGKVSNKLSLPFSIYRKWYETNLFYVILSTFILSLVGFSISSYFQNTKRKKERTKLQFEKRISELELGILQAQMNPHFIFNAINAIQDKVNTGNKDVVTQYLNDFASLMRLYLESSRMNLLTLKMEIKLLELYLNLEKMRFGDKLHFKINIDSEIDTEYTKVPSMILQPFVENAINHGIFHKTTTGHIIINISEDKDENLLVEITDDGIGRKKALEIKQKSYNPHKSRALQIIDERIEVLKELHGFIIKINITDLISDTNTPIGTSVFIKFNNS